MRRAASVQFSVAAAALALLAAATATPASAQGLFEALFGGGVRREMPPRVTSYSDTNFEDRRERRTASAEHGGPSTGFCVRTCDGRFFPVKATGGMSTAELCKSFCPAAKTKVFSGSRIDHSVASDGERYASLDNAFLFRERTVENCTCNGKNSYGLVSLKAENDPSLRAGDIVATNEGLVTYGGKRSGSADFTPVAEARGPEEWRLRLMSIKVSPAPEQTDPPPAPVENKAERSDRRRAQR